MDQGSGISTEGKPLVPFYHYTILDSVLILLATTLQSIPCGLIIKQG